MRITDWCKIFRIITVYMTWLILIYSLMLIWFHEFFPSTFVKPLYFKLLASYFILLVASAFFTRLQRNESNQ